MDMINELKDKVIGGYSISRDEALLLADTPDSSLDELCNAADEIQRHFFDNDFDMCAVISVKGGRCSENCRYCAQSSCAKVPVPAHSMISPDELAANAQSRNIGGIRHYCLVSTGRCVSDRDIDYICEGIRRICHDTHLTVCTSFGLLKADQLCRLKEAGVARIHNNL